MEFDPRTMSADDFERRIHRLLADRDEAADELARIEAELKWWTQGKRIFLSHKSPPADDKPTLRRGIRTVMAEGSATQWRVADLVDALGRRDWLPGGKNYVQRVGDTVMDMTKKRELIRLARGVYSLPDMAPAGANELVLAPSTRAEP